MTMDDYAAELAVQGGGCAICGGTQPGGRGTYFHVDHDHESGRRRGLLCHGCNTGMGAFGDSADRLRKAADYIEQHARLKSGPIITGAHADRLKRYGRV